MAAVGHRWPGQPTPEFGLFSHHAGHVRQSSLETEQDLPSARQRLRDMLDDPSSSGVAQAVHYFIIGAIITGSLLTVVETMPTMRIHAPFLDAMDFLVTIIYSIEIVLRFYATDDCVGFCVFFNIVDVASTLPGYLELVIRAYGESPKAAATVAPIRILRIFRVVRLLRVVRVFKLVKDNHYAQQTALLVEVITEAATHSGLCVILLLFGLMTVIASTLLYLFEAPECLQGWATPRDELYAIPPQDCTARSNFDSIPLCSGGP
ncbi:unnamed protein product [Prorocentrum cordatum]|uniref:Ion transport domain-containing protein n=1 Tax=Prorocentrum cordatum TaxID=2364126 RepID=A0ABN9UBF4_9DINO|nr:unnamed protein product [Polarella glacialis]